MKKQIVLLLSVLLSMSFSMLSAPAQTGAASGTAKPSAESSKAAEQFSSASDQLVLKNYMLRRSGDYQGAENALAEAAKIARSDADKMKLYNAFGGLYMHAGKRAESERYLRDAVNLAEKVLAPDSLFLASIIDNLSTVLGESKKFDEAEKFNSRALEVYKKAPRTPTTIIDIIKTLDNRASIYAAAGKNNEAEKTYIEAIDLAKDFKESPPDLLACLEDNLGGVYAIQGDLRKAEEHKVNALSLYETSLGFNHPDTIKAKKNLAYVYAQEGRFDEANSLLQCAIEKLKNTGSINQPLLDSCIEAKSKVAAMKADSDAQSQKPQN